MVMVTTDLQTVAVEVVKKKKKEEVKSCRAVWEHARWHRRVS